MKLSKQKILQKSSCVLLAVRLALDGIRNAQIVGQ